MEYLLESSNCKELIILRAYTYTKNYLTKQLGMQPGMQLR